MFQIQVRQAALKCMNTWLENSKLSQWIEGETIFAALSNAKHTFLRIEVCYNLNYTDFIILCVSSLPFFDLREEFV